MKTTTLDSVVLNFQSILKVKLKAEKIDSVRIKQYLDSLLKAKDFCIGQFNEEFGKFGGQYTSHGPDHSARVLENSLILADRLSPELNSTELFSLGLSAILHDIGMTAPLPLDFTDNVKDEDLRWIERRKKHGESTLKILNLCESGELKIISSTDEDTYNEFLPHICAAHCTSGFKHHISEIFRLKKQLLTRNRFEIIAGILLLADELDISCIRARPDINKYNEFKSNTTKAHWWKHWLVSDIALNGNTIYISCLDDSVLRWSDEFTNWTKSKIEHQLILLQNILDPNGNDQLWNLEVKIVPVNTIWWKQKLPELTSNIIEEAQKNRLSIPGQKMHKIINPEKLIEGITNRDSIAQPSLFFRNAIARRIGHFRGQGQYVDLESARLLYVEEKRNMLLLDHTINEWLDYVSNKNPGIKLKVFVGDIGVGKTHFLSTFLFEISTKFPTLYQNTIIARSEFTECERDNLLGLQRLIAISLYKDLNIRLKILDPIREIMIKSFKQGIYPTIPEHVEEIVSWSSTEINDFIEVIGMICKKDSKIHKKLGVRAPNSMCLFCDNSDQMKKEIVSDLYEWCYHTSGRADCLVWTFLRPDTLAYLENNTQRTPFSLRPAEPIFAPMLIDVINRRLETFTKKFKENEKIAIASSTIIPVDIQKSITYIVNLTLETSDPILPKLTDRIEGDGQPNLRAGLQALISILGSHVLSDEEYARALLLMRSTEGSAKEPRAAKSVFERWPKILEALILGRRNWYSPLSGAVENLLDPPQIDSYGDYFICIHILQILMKHKLEFKFFEMYYILGHIGYQRGRVQEIIKHLASRAFIDGDQPNDADPLVKRTFPLIEVNISSLDHPFKDNTIIKLTPWGEFHLKTMLYQTQYWKHIFYQIIIPASLTQNLDIKAVKGTAADLKDQLCILFDFLIPIEESWLHPYKIDELSDMGLTRLMPKIKDKVIQQLG